MIERGVPHRRGAGTAACAQPLLSDRCEGRVARRPWQRALASTGLLVTVLVAGGCTTSQTQRPTTHPTVSTPRASLGSTPASGSSTASAAAAVPTDSVQAPQRTLSSPSGTVEVVVTYSQRAAGGFVELGAYVPGYITDHGRCRASLADATIVGQWTDGVPDATGTSCGALRLKIGSGSADVVIEFVSDSEQGRSAPRAIGAP